MNTTALSAHKILLGLLLDGITIWYLATHDDAKKQPEQQPPISQKPAFKEGMYDSDSEISMALAGFKTFDGRSLTQVLGDLGLHVKSVFVDEIHNSQPGDQPGDVVYDVTMEGDIRRDVPCENMLPQQPSGKEPILEEALRQATQFPVAQEEGNAPTGPILFWAATGRCSKAY